MFSYDKQSSRVVCLEDYGRLKKGAIVPVLNELYADVEAWLAAGNTLAEFDGYPEIPMSQEQLQDWRESASVSARQGMEQLIVEGLDEQVDQVIDAIEDPVERKLARNWIQKAGTWDRMNAQLNQIADALGLTEGDKDQLFRNASKR
ncbi:hypothetical protein [Halomonas sp. Mc5H-6]|uniref:hypothetical protein n=1 Tax=Halomonas sp. Mc5H-6 TaxID=2954500 RepID=UPI002097E99C|nr:hypothetical protein [Halomonas sp. Mc5H-6]MCO7248174.1 hypothetical protein [Halomonas sp. Mc5H-6]